MICNVCQEAAYQNTVQELSLEEAEALHEHCKGGTFCDCQHKPTRRQQDGSVAQRRN